MKEVTIVDVYVFMYAFSRINFGKTQKCAHQSFIYSRSRTVA